jgi:L-asparaginase
MCRGSFSAWPGVGFTCCSRVSVYCFAAASYVPAAVTVGVPVALHTQCLRGTVDLRAYEGGRAALDAGALPTGSMTVEAATVKLMFLLAQGLTEEDLRVAYQADLAGEGAASAP